MTLSLRNAFKHKLIKKEQLTFKGGNEDKTPQFSWKIESNILASAVLASCTVILNHAVEHTVTNFDFRQNIMISHINLTVYIL